MNDFESNPAFTGLSDTTKALLRRLTASAAPQVQDGFGAAQPTLGSGLVLDSNAHDRGAAVDRVAAHIREQSRLAFAGQVPCKD